MYETELLSSKIQVILSGHSEVIVSTVENEEKVENSFCHNYNKIQIRSEYNYQDLRHINGYLTINFGEIEINIRKQIKF